MEEYLNKGKNNKEYVNEMENYHDCKRLADSKNGVYNQVHVSYGSFRAAKIYSLGC